MHFNVLQTAENIFEFHVAMAPVPLEGSQTPANNNVIQEVSKVGSMPLATLIEFIIQRTYHELTVLAEL